MLSVIWVPLENFAGGDVTAWNKEKVVVHRTPIPTPQFGLSSAVICLDFAIGVLYLGIRGMTLSYIARIVNRPCPSSNPYCPRPYKEIQFIIIQQMPVVDLAEALSPPPPSPWSRTPPPLRVTHAKVWIRIIN